MTLRPASQDGRQTVFLAGPPGAGKSTAATAIAGRLGLGSTDLDARVEELTGVPPGELIRSHGEAVFRSRELEAILELPPTPQVVALGGGTLTQEAARGEVRARGVLVGLDMSAEALWRRLSSPDHRGPDHRGPAADRPLLAGASIDGVRSMLDQRQRAYASVDRRIDAEQSVEAVSDAIIEAIDDLHLIPITVSQQRSRVLVGRGLQQSLVGAVAHLNPRRPVVVITDGGIPDSARRAWVEPLAAWGHLVLIEGPGGEAMKSWSRLGEVLERALAAGAGRQSVVVGIGGGATCDLAGMTAGLLGRGAPLVLVPSTLLAQVDASVGGKAAVNAEAGRNLIGCFHAAHDVLVDLDLLVSLSDEERRSGLAELVKMAALFDESLFDRVVERTPLSPAMVARAVQLKAEVVARDPFEKNERRLLNFGHTLAHGIEAASNYEWRHGEAVAVGIAAITRWAAAEKWMDAGTRDRLLHGLTTLGLPVSAPTQLLTEAVGFLGQDKKAAGDRITVVTLRALEQPILREISLATVQKALLQHGGEQ